MKKLFPYYHKICKKLGLQDYIYKKNVAPINHIIDNVYLGDFRCADDLDLLKKNNITHIVNCAFNLPNSFPNEITYKNLNLKDEKNQPLLSALQEAYKFIKDNKDKNVLIHCVYGKSRSASVVLFYLINEKKYSFQEAKEFARKIRICVNPNEGFERELIKYYEDNIAKLKEEK